MTSPDATLPTGEPAGSADEAGGTDVLDTVTPARDTRSRRPFVAGRAVPNERIDRGVSPPPEWVDRLLDEINRTRYHRALRGVQHIGVWERLVRRLPLTSQAKAVAAVLVEHWPEIRPSIRRLHELSGLSSGSVKNGIHLLCQAGLLEVQSATGGSSTYIPLYPERAITEAEVALVKANRRSPGVELPGHQVATPGHLVTTPPGHRVTTHPDTPWPTPGHQVTNPWPPGDPEVLNQVPKEDLNQVLTPVSSDADPPPREPHDDETKAAAAAGLPAARAALENARAPAGNDAPAPRTAPDPPNPKEIHQHA